MSKKRKHVQNREGGFLIGIIGDEDTVTGFLLSGIGEVNKSTKKRNYLVVTSSKNCKFKKKI